MTLQEYINKYEEKTGEKFKADKRFELFFLPDKGFCEVGQSPDGQMLIINQLCGDARFWKDKVSEVAKSIGLKICGTWCIRPAVEAYIRLFGYRITKTDTLSDGRKKYYCVHKNGGAGWVSPSFTDTESGNEGYFVTWEV